MYLLGTGSPPLTRGKGTELHTAINRHRITPAYAGKRTIYTRAYVRPGDHPRLRGEKSSFSAVVNASKGSPPLTRGKGLRGGVASLSFRITPAYAGKSYKGIIRVYL